MGQEASILVATGRSVHAEGTPGLRRQRAWLAGYGGGFGAGAGRYRSRSDGRATRAGRARGSRHGEGGAAATCGKATGPFSVSGTQVLGAGGKPFVSYGLTVSGLQGPDWANWVSQDLQEITATADDWCANTVRLQVNQDDLIGPTGPASTAPT